MIITIEGNIGAGKSTFAAVLSAKLKALGFKTINIEEPVDKWLNFNGHNFLKTFYEDKTKWSFAFQVNALVDTVENELKAADCSSDEEIIIMERSTFSVCELFTEMLLNDKFIQPLEVDILRKVKDSLMKNLHRQKNRVVIYLKTDPELCYKRLMRRGRKGEVESINKRYIQSLHYIHEKKFSHLHSNDRLIVLDGSRDVWWIDFGLRCGGFFLRTDVSQ